LPGPERREDSEAQIVETQLIGPALDRTEIVGAKSF
jgi:hypothetical protein